jgi:hypothetical protein
VAISQSFVRHIDKATMYQESQFSDSARGRAEIQLPTESNGEMNDAIHDAG